MQLAKSSIFFRRVITAPKLRNYIHIIRIKKRKKVLFYEKKLVGTSHELRMSAIIAYFDYKNINHS